MGPKGWIALGAVAVVGGWSVVPIAGGHGSPPRATIACKRIAPGVCEESGNIHLPPNSNGSQTTDTVPRQSTGEESLLTPLNAGDLAGFDSLWESVAQDDPKLSKIHNTTIRRVITCAVMARGVANLYGSFTGKTNVNARVRGDNADAVLLAMCIQATVTGQNASTGPQADVSSTRCSQAMISIPVQISRSASGFVVQANSPVSKASGRKPLAISCQAKGNGMLIKVRPSRHGRKLRQVIGTHFSIGYSNPTTSSVGVRTTFTFK